MKPILLTCLLLSGCATCRQEPVHCIAGAVIVGAVAVYALDHPRQDYRHHDKGIGEPGRGP